MTTTAAPADWKSLVLQAVDAVDLIRRATPLRRVGPAFQGTCPFCRAEDYTLSVSPRTQRFRCHGCGAGGNAIDFVMRRDGLTFIDALKRLAEQAGVELPHA